MSKIPTRVAACALFTAAACFSPLALAHGNHTHGHGNVQVSVDGAAMTVRLDVPLEAYLGYDYPPRNEKQQQVWQAFVERVADPLRFVEPPAEAQCKLSGSRTEPALGEVVDPKVDIANLVHEIRFECAQPEALKSLSFSAFRDHPGLKQLRVRLERAGAKKTQTIRPRFPALVF